MKAAATEALLALVAFKVDAAEVNVNVVMPAPVPAVAEKVTTVPAG